MMGSTANIDATNNTHDELDNNNDEVNINGEDEDTYNAMDTATALSLERIASHVLFINECNSESVSDHVDNNDNDSIRDDNKHECAVSPI